MLDKLIPLADENVWALGANVTLSGLVIVFLGLILLVLVLSLFSLFFSRNKAAKPIPAAQPVPAVQPAASVVVPAQQEEDEALIAVIAAAVDAMYSGSGKRAVIRSVRPAAGTGRPVWASAGILENTRAF